MDVSCGRIRRAALSASVAAAALVGVLGLQSASADADTLSAGQPVNGSPTVDAPCGVDQKAPTNYKHVVWILLENKSYDQVAGSPDAPYLNKLAGQCGLATNDKAISHPSLPNYIAMTSGGLQGVADDANPSAHPLDVPSIFSQLGGDWRGLDESMKTNCEQTNDGHYAVRHNPAAYYTNIRTICNAAKDVPLTEKPDLSAKFTFVTPDVCDDMHSDCSGTGAGAAGELQRGDAFMSSFMSKLINSEEYQSGQTAVFVTFDEGEDSTNKVFTEVIAPSVKPGTQSDTPFTHYSMLHTTEELLGLPYLGEAASATSMRTAFGL